MSLKSKKKRRRILFGHGGGPAPASCAVIEGGVKEAEKLGLECYGIPFGFQHLREGDISRLFRITTEMVDGISYHGGTFMPTARASLIGDPNFARSVVRACREMQAPIDFLAFAGGDDTGGSLNAAQQAAIDIGYLLGVVHYNKTIDNDYRGPALSDNTYGADSAAEEGADDIVALVKENVSNPDRVFVLEIMGRHAGWLAWMAAMKAWNRPRVSCYRYPERGSGPLLTLIPELFPKKVPLRAIVRAGVGAQLKSLMKFGECGAVLTAEGIPYCCTEESVKDLLEDIPLDDHGHPRLKEVTFVPEFAKLIKGSLKEIGVRNFSGGTIDVTPVEAGYGRLRCGCPSEIDRKHGLAIGKASIRWLLAGNSGATTWYRPAKDGKKGQVLYRPFSKSIDPESGRMPTQMLDLRRYRRLFEDGPPFLTRADLENPSLISLTGLKRDEFESYFGEAVEILEHVA